MRRSHPSLPGLARTMHGIAIEAHRRFQDEVWRARDGASVETGSGRRIPAYHDESHVESVVACARAVYAAAQGGLDPFDLRRDLDAWNVESDVAVDWEAFGPALEIAFSCHDLGNVTRSAELLRGPAGEAVLDLGLFYDSSTLYPVPAVEIRSAAIATGLLARLCLQEDLCARLEPLIRHLILSTVFDFDVTSSAKPFWLAMQTVDMVGSYFFSGVPRCVSVAGLFNEMRVQKPGTIPLRPFLESLQRRFELLLPEPGRRAEVLTIFEGNPHGTRADKVFPVPDRFSGDCEPIPYDEAIRRLLDGPEPATPSS